MYMKEKYDKIHWHHNSNWFKKWCDGETGFPIVDAGMRQMNQTGYMHNRVRMIVGSFLVKNLLIHWNYGERWFWNCLFDADLASNSCSWQWVAGANSSKKYFANQENMTSS